MTGVGFSPNDSFSDLRTTPAITYGPVAIGQPPPQRLGIGQEAPHELLVDDRLQRRRRIVEGGEVPPRAQRNAHRPEVVRA